MQKPNNPPTRFKRIRRFPKHQEKKLQSQTKIRRQLLRRLNPTRNHRLHERTRKTNERNGKPMHGRLPPSLPKLLTWQKKQKQKTQ